MIWLVLSIFCAYLRESAVWRSCGPGKAVTATVSPNGPTASIEWAIRGFVAGMVVAKCSVAEMAYEKGKLNMKKLVSFLLGVVVLFGAATFGLQSGSASAAAKHDKKYYKHHRHHRHHRHRRNKLSY
jgi:type IV secretory pathway VirB2 component (pilin)